MRGKLIVLDGTDGSGKDTQTDLLLKAAQKRGLSAAIIRFPSHGETFSGRVIRDEYLTGKLGDLADCHPKLVCYLYAVDRFEQQAALNKLLSSHDLVIATRYVISNIAYQAARIPEADRMDFRQWAETLDYDVMKNPKEDAVVFLSLPVDLATQLIEKRNAGKQVARDLHDENKSYQRDVLSEYQTLCSSHDHWYQVDCELDGGIRTIDDIAQQLDQLVFEQILIPAEVLV
jgi:dTMP kinase